jgi:hypothetical protein
MVAELEEVKECRKTIFVSQSTFCQCFPGTEDDSVRTSILVEGMTLGATDVNRFTDIRRLNGEVIEPLRQDSEEVLIVVNNSTNVQRRVSITHLMDGCVQQLHMPLICRQ